jgi:hypothetical protein
MRKAGVETERTFLTDRGARAIPATWQKPNWFVPRSCAQPDIAVAARGCHKPHHEMADDPAALAP